MRNVSDSSCASRTVDPSVFTGSNLDLSEKRGLGIMNLIFREYLADPANKNTTELNPEFLADALTQVKTLLVAGSGTTSVITIKPPTIREPLMIL